MTQQENIKILHAHIGEAIRPNDTPVLHEAVQKILLSDGKLQLLEEHHDAQEDLARHARSKGSKKKRRRNHTGVG